MNKLEELKKIYEGTTIPEELSQVVQNALKENFDDPFVPLKTIEIIEDKGKRKMNENKKNKKLYRTIASTAAALIIVTGVFSIGIHTNEAFADSVSNVPILGNLVRVLIGEQMDEGDSVVHVEMTLPKVEGLSDKTTEDRINKEIHDKMTAIVEESKQRAIEDKEAFVETGGKEEDFMQREIIVNYEVKNISDNVLSFIVRKTETSASAYFEQFYYNIDLNTNKDVTLEDCLGEEYKSVANEQIKAEIAERSKDPDNMYWDDSDGIAGFNTISDQQNFYINETGNPVIVFNKYEIAPGYMGIQEFEIQSL
ncbi:MAG: DUF3298 domain-containing protein [Anaerovorax sp.]|nr:DUF3298 domain-containing protein [Anaerovorax sp.]